MLFWKACFLQSQKHCNKIKIHYYQIKERSNNFFYSFYKLLHFRRENKKQLNSHIIYKLIKLPKNKILKRPISKNFLLPENSSEPFKEMSEDSPEAAVNVEDGA